MDAVEPLPPAHFLTRRKFGDQEEVVVASLLAVSGMRALKESVDLHLQELWRRWRTDYLRNLPAVEKGDKKCTGPQVRLLVLIEEDHLPRLTWNTSVVTELLLAADGVVRCVRLRSGGSVNVRPD